MTPPRAPNILISKEQAQSLHNVLRQIEKSYLVATVQYGDAVDWMAMRNDDQEVFLRYIQLRRVLRQA